MILSELVEFAKGRRRDWCFALRMHGFYQKVPLETNVSRDLAFESFLYRKGLNTVEWGKKLVRGGKKLVMW